MSSILQQECLDEDPIHPPLSKEVLMNILLDAQRMVWLQYFDNPDIFTELRYRLRSALADCELGQRDPQKLLELHLRGERTVLDAYNKHRLGKAAWRYEGAQLPDGDFLAPYDEEANIPEIETSFPLRSAAQHYGARFDPLQPIYQVTDHVARVQPIPSDTLNIESSSPPPESKEAVNKPPKTPKTPLTQQTSKIGRAAASYNKLGDAPSPNLEFPCGNLTAAEIIAFAPQWLKSVHVINRFVSNRATSATIARMMNKFRYMPSGEINSNSVYAMMKPAMRKTQPSWTVGTHIMPDSWDSKNIAVDDFQTPRKTHPSRWVRYNIAAKPIPFKELADGVREMPTNDDALDLTRCIEYHLKHLDEDWLFPIHFQQLVERLGGPIQVQFTHHDPAAFKRYDLPITGAAAMNMFKRKRDKHGRILKRKAEEIEEEASDDDLSDEHLDYDKLDDRGINDEIDNIESTFKTSRGRKRTALGRSAKRVRPSSKVFTPFHSDHSDLEYLSIGAENSHKPPKCTMQTRTQAAMQEDGSANRARPKYVFDDFESGSDDPLPIISPSGKVLPKSIFDFRLSGKGKLNNAGDELEESNSASTQDGDVGNLSDGMEDVED